MNFLLSFAKGSKSAEGGKNPLADMARGGPILEGSISASGFGPGGPILGGSKSARTPATLQPRSRGLSSQGRKTQVQAGHVPPKKWEVAKKLLEREVSKSPFCLSLTHYGKGKFV